MIDTVMGASRTTDSDSDGHVNVVQDTSAYLESIQASKGSDTRWVRGLSPEDEEMERQTQRVRDEVVAASAEREALDARRREDHLARRWLRRPLLLGFVYLTVLLFTYQNPEGFAELMLVDFPESEEHAWGTARQTGENATNFFLRVAPALLLPSGLAAAATACLCFILGSAAHHFTTLCGVGTSLLSFLAATAQFAVLWHSCGISRVSRRYECDLPFVLYWVCSVVRVGAPLLAMCFASTVMDIARRSHHLKYLLGLPVVAFVVAVGVSVRNEKTATRLFQLSYELAVPLWAYFMALCWNQPSFTVVVTEMKMHMD